MIDKDLTNDFYTCLSKINPSQNDMENIGYHIVYYNKIKFIELLINKFNFIVTDVFINNICLSLKLDMYLYTNTYFFFSTELLESNPVNIEILIDHQYNFDIFKNITAKKHFDKRYDL